MNTKNRVLQILENNRGISLSGEEIAAKIGVSRSAVWKAVNSLKDDGFKIDAATNRGYSISSDNDVLSPQSLFPYIKGDFDISKIRVYKSLESTNITAKELAVAGAPHGTVIIADTQTAGRGRYGKTFFSPPKDGLYITIILRPEELKLPNITAVTAAAAVAVCRALRAISDRQPQIKWVNDVYMDGKKICGILTEAVTGFESGTVDWVVVGIGVNLHTRDFPPEIANSATSVLGCAVSGTARARLAAEIINILVLSDIFSDAAKIYSEYRSLLMWLGGRVTVTGAASSYDADVLDIDGEGRLIVRKDDGTVAALSSGEVSVRK